MKKITLAELRTVFGFGIFGGLLWLLFSSYNIYWGIAGCILGAIFGISICVKRRSMTQSELDKIKALNAKPKCPFCNEPFTYLTIIPANLAKFILHIMLATFAILKHFPMRWKCASCEKTFVFTRSIGSDSDSG